MNHMLYHPDKVEENSDHTPVPNSPWMRLMYMLTSDKYQEYVVPHLKNYFDQDCSPEENIPSDLNEYHEHPEPQEEPPKRKGNKLQDL